MVADPLYQPLGLEPAPPPSPRRGGGGVAAVLVVVLVCAVGGGIWWERHQQARVNQAVAIAPIETVKPPPPEAPPAAPATPPPARPAAPEGATVEVQNGVKIVRLNPAASSAGVAIQVPGAGPLALAPAPDPRVSETTPWGTLPRIGAKGLKPAIVYARPGSAVPGPSVALLITGLGRDQMAAADAARRLPPAVAFGFGPEVPDAASQVAEARRAGHEAVLTLQDGVDSPSNAGNGVDDLHRLMGRWAGYVGVYVANAAALDAAERRDVDARGLVLFSADPGTAGDPPAIGGIAATGQGGAAIGPLVTRLTAAARGKVTPIGILDASAVSVSDLAGLADQLAAAGLTLVPLTTAAGLTVPRQQ